MSNNLRKRQNISLSLDELSKSLFDIAKSLESNDNQHHHHQHQHHNNLNFDHFSPILGEDGHLFSQEEIEKVLLLFSSISNVFFCCCC